MSAQHHREDAAQTKVRAAVITVSSTRTEAEDTGGKYLAEALEAQEHTVVARSIVDDDVAAIRDRITEHVHDGVGVVVVTGGTGLTARDVTPEAVEPLFTRRIDGFGELFRALSFQEIGAAAMLSRAVGGLVGSTAVFALPGSPKACRLAMERLILPEIRHLTHLASKVEVSGRGWLQAIQQVQGVMHRDERPDDRSLPDPVRNVLHGAGEVATLVVEDRRYGLWGFPDLRRPASKVLALRAEGDQLEVVALHRHPQPVGCVVRDGWLPHRPGVFAVAGDVVYAHVDGRVELQGPRPRDLGTPAQALASLVLEWSTR